MLRICHIIHTDVNEVFNQIKSIYVDTDVGLFLTSLFPTTPLK